MFDARGAVRKAVATKGEGRWGGGGRCRGDIFIWADYIRHLAVKVLTAIMFLHGDGQFQPNSYYFKIITIN
jgi:hypothetical protein